MLSFAHCDSRNGPVVKAAKEALEKNNINLVLIWVQQKDEKEVKSAFVKTMAVRSMNEKARTLADEYFFETVVRLHRAGEGETYTGIKDEATPESILTAEKAIERKSSDSLYFDLTLRIQRGLDQHLLAVLTSSSYNVNDVKAGREYISNYINFIHFVEALYNTSSEAPILHHDHEGFLVAVPSPANNDQRTNIPVSSNNQFSLLLIAAFIIMGLLLIITFIQNKNLRIKYHKPEFR